MKPGLSEKELSQIISILKGFPSIQEAVLFGSRAMGTFKPASDVDIALKGKITQSVVARAKAILEEESPLPYTFDVVDYHTIENPAFKEHIDKWGILIHQS